MPCASETELRTLDLDTASPHCSFLSPPCQAPAALASASSLPSQLSPHSAGWNRVTHKGPQDHWRRFDQVPCLVLWSPSTTAEAVQG